MRPGVFGAESLLHLFGPDASGSSELADFFEEIVVGVKEETEPGREFVNLQTPVQSVADILETVGQRESQFLDGVGTSLPYMVATDADGVPAGYVTRGVFYGVSHQAHGRLRREDVLVLGDKFFEYVVLNGTAQLVQGSALFFCQSDVHGPDDRRRAIDRHGRGDLFELDPVEEGLHVGQGGHGDAAGAELAGPAGVIGIVAVECGHVECDAQPCLTLLQEELEPGVGFFRQAETGEHSHGPEPTTVTGSMDAPQVGVFPGQSLLF